MTVAAACLCLVCVLGSGNALAVPASGRGKVVQVAAAENFWGNIAAQLGGSHAHVTSIISNPNTDPHDYEPTAQDARTIAGAGLVIENGIGYDPWAAKIVASEHAGVPVVDVGNLVGVAAGGNPHRWYNPEDVQTVVRAIVTKYKKLDPAHSAYFDARRTKFDTVALARYDALIASIKAKYSGTPVGASESIFAMLAPALGLDLVTPPSFLRAVSEGSDVTAADKTTIDAQIKNHTIKIYVYNSQNVTPDVKAQLKAVKAAHIPYATITETLVPQGSSYQAWQVKQLEGIQAALAKSVTG